MHYNKKLLHENREIITVIALNNFLYLQSIKEGTITITTRRITKVKIKLHTQLAK